MTYTRVDVILFDLGNVILPFNHYQIGEKLARFSQEKASQDSKEIFSFLFDQDRGAVNRYETGKISSIDFFDSVRAFFHLEISFDEFVAIWNDIFTENVEVSEIIRTLKGRKRLGLVSNTNALHFDYVASTFPVVNSFDRWILSHEVGFRKPFPEIYQKAIEWASVEPPHILFIDDMQRNVDAAISLGIEAIRFGSARQLKEALSLRLNSRG